MANAWLRLWHDMPNDPKWRTISRVSGQEISLVQATYIHLLVSASQNVTRGHADVTPEDLSSALNVTEDQIVSVLSAMQGRVLEGEYISGWDRRQVRREESDDPQSPAMTAKERKRKQRERDREKKINMGNTGNVTGGHDESHNVPLDKIREEVKEREREVREKPVDNSQPKFAIPPDWIPADGFPNRAAKWGHAVGEPGFTPAQLQQFRDYWKPGGVTRYQLQWEIAFAESLSRQKSSAERIPTSRNVNAIDEPDKTIPTGFVGSNSDASP